MKKIFRNQKGFTLVELLLYMGIFSILIVALFQLLSSILDVQLESQSTAGVSQDGRFIVNRLSYDIQRSTSIISPSLGSQGQSMQLSDGTTTYSYTLTNGNLILTSTPPGTVDELNSYNTSVSNINFLRLGNAGGLADTITVSFTLTSKIIRRGGAPSKNFKTTIGIRK